MQFGRKTGFHFFQELLQRPAMHPSSLIDQRFVAGFLLGPLLGAVLYAGVLSLSPGAGSQGFWYYLATSLAYGYATSLILLLPSFLALRHFRIDRWVLCIAAGLAAGLIFHLFLFHLPATSSNVNSLVLYGAMPFVFIACSIRLIAGKRA